MPDRRADAVSEPDQLVAARLALSHCDWQGAYDATSSARWPEADPAREADRLDVLADAAWWLGRLDECIEAREGAYVRYDALGDRRRAGQCAVWLYEHYCFKARPAIAGGWLRRARHALEDDPESAEYGALRLREAETAHSSGNLRASANAAREVVDLGRRLRSPDLEAEALQTLGRVQLASSDRSACATLRQAAERWQELGVPHEVATARMLRGAACREAGDLDGAAASFEAAGALFEQLGAALDLRNLSDVTSTTPELPSGLTTREVEVLRLVAAGMTNKQIAGELFLSEKTIARHLSNIFVKTNVATRSAATAFAFEHRLVT